MNRVDNIDLTGGSLLKSKGKKNTKAKPKSRSGSKTKKTRSASPKTKSPAKAKKATKAKPKSRSGSKTKTKSKKNMNMASHKLADNLIQLGVQLKNHNMEGTKKPKTRKTHTSSILLA